MSFINIVDRFVNSVFAHLPRSRPSAKRLAQARLIAHRGAHDHQKQIIENTDQAFARALALHCWGIEFDVHATADHVLVVHHDPDLARLWGQNVAIKDLSFKALRALIPEIPSLDEVVSRYGKQLHLFIELKTALCPKDSLEESLKPLSPCADYHLLSLDESLFASLTAFPNEALLLVPEIHNVEAFCTLSLNKSYGGVMGHYLLLTNQRLSRLWQAKQSVGLGFIDSEYSLYRELNRGVDWLFSNKADIISRCLASYRQK